LEKAEHGVKRNRWKINVNADLMGGFFYCWIWKKIPCISI